MTGKRRAKVYRYAAAGCAAALLLGAAAPVQAQPDREAEGQAQTAVSQEQTAEGQAQTAVSQGQTTVGQEQATVSQEQTAAGQEIPVPPTQSADPGAWGSAPVVDTAIPFSRQVFDPVYYYETNEDLWAIRDPEMLYSHYMLCGAREGRSASADFNLRAYIIQNRDLLNAFGKDYERYYEHYLLFGRGEGRPALFEEEPDYVGTYTTFYDTTQQRAVNVELSARRVNGTILQPGEEFSFSDTVLSRTYENGYVLGPSFAGGRLVVSVGGGICQTSSTLYMAMISAQLPATERHSHSGLVDYVPYGMDAAISENVKDLRFTNVFSRPMLITVTTHLGVLTVKLHVGDEEELARIWADHLLQEAAWERVEAS